MRHGLPGPVDAPIDIEHNNVNEKISRIDVATTRIPDDLSALATRVEKGNRFQTG